MHAEGLVHSGVELRFDGEGHRIALSELTGGRAITIYGQQEVVKDLIEARVASGLPLYFEVSDVSVDPSTPRSGSRTKAHSTRWSATWSRAATASTASAGPRSPPLTVYEREYPFGWLGILAECEPSSEELIYAHHERGFALASMRSPTVTRMYLQCEPGEDVANWSDQAIWNELDHRFGMSVNRGDVFEKSVTPMRSFVVEPMQHQRLYLAGDAAHIVPPTGAKGLNTAMADVYLLAHGIEAFYGGGDSRLDAYSSRALERVWRVQHFSWWMTSMLHRFQGDDDFQLKLQQSQLRYTVYFAARPPRSPRTTWGCRSSRSRASRARRRLPLDLEVGEPQDGVPAACISRSSRASLRRARGRSCPRPSTSTTSRRSGHTRRPRSPAASHWWPASEASRISAWNASSLPLFVPALPADVRMASSRIAGATSVSARPRRASRRR